jgi:hypothetical protein
MIISWTRDGCTTIDGGPWSDSALKAHVDRHEGDENDHRGVQRGAPEPGAPHRLLIHGSSSE